MSKDTLFELRDSFNEVWSVFELNKFISNFFDKELPFFYVKGEISNFVIASSGHWYFTLKDSQASVRVVMFKGYSSSVLFVPKNGDQVQVYAKLSLYTPRGDYQLQATGIIISGTGNLHEQYLMIKNRLALEGLFAKERKKSIKTIPNSVGIITSLKAAALKDVIAVFKRRAPYVRLIIYPAPVQGENSSHKIIEQLKIANRRLEVDTLLLVRGGGSLEDMWCFNNEDLARAISVSLIPIISGIGHDIDFTIADFVVDLHAPTPTAAAELACVAKKDLENKLYWCQTSISKSQTNLIRIFEQNLDKLSFRIISPEIILNRKKDIISYFFKLLSSMVKEPKSRYSQKITILKNNLLNNKPALDNYLSFINSYADKLFRIHRSILLFKKNSLGHLESRLHLLNPENVLLRGYSFVRSNDGKLVRSSKDLVYKQRLEIQFSDGKVDVLVDS
ncbi:exodeoxyribonuclease VII large subunit [Candidatus Kinetoplastidibacterium crithidiae]|uniref:Exodeoxyribonuclease 7 large subunit n=1 Tax=Candidatus Kinetoplastidibacterium crithidiae TCC036E TaxID=1208918 RepID=M1LPH7_9PROT|nr:exodeoxyribonuclease VII large subunit [Candidatus Kinetoplastibacterium crithidii]AFZ82771.1 exodeoxyribonuclease VII large subunit [Candidatus Kinetoplastibacterium crithidii (ex Angomonas deanei ATCC 30255)]AGF47577.1 exodeoxyribonuclease VII large subunit [Candidatus Kinetoplastibacterium crithidii TCC036E]